MRRSKRASERGQILALGVLAMTALILGTALVIDGGLVYAKRREAQNAADFAAMAGTRIVGVARTGRPAGAGTAANVENAVNTVLAANGAHLDSAQYVDEAGVAVGNVVGANVIPDSAYGVVVNAQTDYKPYLLGVIGVVDWGVGARATALTTGQSYGGDVLPIGLQDTRFGTLESCTAADLFDCADSLTGAQKNIPGGFGWLKFGLNNGNKCDWGPSLGMIDGGCESSKTFLDEQIGPPSNSYGCCGPVGEPPGSADLIGSLTGNEWGDLSIYVEKKIPVWVPIWDTAGGTGANGYYHIVGFGPIYLTGDNEHAKWLEGVRIKTDCIRIVDGQEVDYSIPVDENDPSKGILPYCRAPLGEFTFDATGEVRLVR